MKLTTGRIVIPLEFDNGDKEEISLNPHDKDLMDRLRQFADLVNEKIDAIDLSKYQSRFDSKEEIEIDIEDLSTLTNLSKEQTEIVFNRMKAINEMEDEINQILKDELDRAFQSNISVKAFKWVAPLAQVTVEDENGNIVSIRYIKYFLDKLFDAIKARAPMTDAVKKHIGEYVN